MNWTHKEAHIFWYCYTINTDFAFWKLLHLKKIVAVLKVTNNGYKKKNLKIINLITMIPYVSWFKDTSFWSNRITVKLI